MSPARPFVVNAFSVIMRNRFLKGLFENQNAFGLDVGNDAETLADYYEFVLEHNSLLHLVGPCSPEEFAIRHILESLMLLEHLPEGGKFVDVGAGAGLPSIPCLIVRKDLKAVLIESKEKKALFLTAAGDRLGIADRITIVNRQFEEADPSDCGYVTCRAMDKFTQKLPRLIKWCGTRRWLFFGGNNLGAELEKIGARSKEGLLPLSKQRFLFVEDK